MAHMQLKFVNYVEKMLNKSNSTPYNYIQESVNDSAEQQERLQNQKWRISLERRNNSFYRQGLYGYVSFKTQEEQAPKVFVFPLSREGFEIVQSKQELAYLLKTKFKEAYPNPQMQCLYDISEAKGPGPMKDEEYKLYAKCRICTNSLVYVKNMFTENVYKLAKMVEYHVHGTDPNKVEEILRKTHNYSRFTLREGRPYEIKPIYLDEKTETSIEDYIRKLPVEITNESRCKIVCDKYKITELEYKAVMRGIKAEYEISLRELLDKFDKKCYVYRLLPQNLTEINEEFILNQKQAEFQHNLKEYDPNRKKDIHEVDEVNPDIPNVILIITPQMKELFYKYGHYVGFDLTFSLIKEKPTHETQYLVGVFAGTSQSRRILVYGLVVTNNQSEEVYRYIFSEFISIMGKGPETIITDEQMSMYYALRSLKKEGIWKGQHLLDTFHILKKFRKKCEPGSQFFQLLRRMIHARDHYQYRRAFRLAQLQVNSDEQMSVLRNFDLNSDKYCYSQVDPTFIGIGISDAINEKFHDIIKAQLPYETKYIKAVCIILDIIESRNDLNRFGIIDKNPIEQRMSLPFVRPYRTILSDKIFHFFLKQIYKSLPYEILTTKEENTVDQSDIKFQANQPLIRTRDRFKIKTSGGIFGVWLDQAGAINDTKQKQGKWRCYCQFEEKSGYLCSHIIKVLMFLKQDFMDNINPRWIIRQDQIEQGLIKFIFRERKFHHFTRVRLRRNPRTIKDDDTQGYPKKEREIKIMQNQQNEDSEEEDDTSTTAFGINGNTQPGGAFNYSMY